ncbi:MAG: hypothetical protein NWF14_05865 [Candidatus Bathyarchaeota archaeon]|jgi:hypothetical protein|nr:hypothetical protein [Candidatus Bathyarchaeota archaeon]
MASLPGDLMALDPSIRLPKAESQIDRYPEHIYIRSKEEIAYELFMYALINLGELKFINSYDEYLEAYKKALETVYSSGR